MSIGVTMEKLEALYIAGGNVMIQLLWKPVWQLLNR